MGTRLTLVIETTFEPDDLRKMVAEIDELNSEPGEGIAAEYVTAYDIIECVMSGELSLHPLLGLDLEMKIRNAGGDIHKALDGVTVDRIERI